MIVRNHTESEIEPRKNNAIMYDIKEKDDTPALKQIEDLMRMKLKN